MPFTTFFSGVLYILTMFSKNDHLEWSVGVLQYNEKQTEKYHTVRTFPQSIRKTTNTGKIDITSTKYMTANFPSLVQAHQ
jgi:hypothetical protein